MNRRGVSTGRAWTLGAAKHVRDLTVAPPYFLERVDLVAI